MKALVIDDDLNTQQYISCFFKNNNFEVQIASGGLDGLKLLKKLRPEIVLLDIKASNFNGSKFIEIVRDLPHEYGHPIIITTSYQTDIEDVLTVLEAGANDYLKKPFDLRELLLRIEKLLSIGFKNKKKFIFDRIIVDDNRHLVTENGIEVELSKKEYDLLIFFFRNQEIVLSRKQILHSLWDKSYNLGDRSVDIYISKLRHKLKSISQCLKTVKSVGYKLERREGSVPIKS